MTLNIENLTRLKTWLEDGAPHIAFTMDMALNPIDDVHDPDDYFEDRGQTGVGDCGTVCCIAGAAYLMAHDMFEKPHVFHNIDWDRIEGPAAAWLGLKSDHPDSAFHFSLFDPDAAPENCTPQEAAEAVQRVIDGNPPWPEEET